MKMENSIIYPDAATEIIEIFKFVEEPVLEKIPEKLKNELERISNKEYNFKFDETKTLNEQKLLPATKELLSAIFIKYCCREEDGNEILVACRENDIRLEEEKRKKYDPDKIFEKKQKEQVEEIKQAENTDGQCFKLVVIEPWYKKVTRKIKNFFRRFI